MVELTYYPEKIPLSHIWYQSTAKFNVENKYYMPHIPNFGGSFNYFILFD